MKREVNKPAAIITAIVLGILICVLLIAGIRVRKEAERKGNEYTHVLGRVIECESYEHNDDDGNTYYTYAATVQYEAGDEIITIVTDDIFHSEIEVDETIDIMYISRLSAKDTNAA